MHEIVEIDKCSGCHACYNICPSKCIEMKADGEGFLFPQIDESLCVDCGLCKKVCPINNTYSPNSKGKAYACINKDETARMGASSGGMFSIFASYVLENNGIVFGAAFDKNLCVRHIGIDKIDDLHLLRSSKYVQSIIGDTYNLVKKHLSSGKLVLFSGTPCQISGLKRFLGQEYDNLIMVDIVCHGVPSPAVWRKYIEHQEKEFCSKVINLPSFRNKENGWKNYKVKLEFENGNIYSQGASHDLYMKAFINNLCLRHSCYNCHSKSIERESDITLADFWGIENVLPEMYDDKGTSLVIVNSEKGEKLFGDVSSEFVHKSVDIDVAAIYNSSMYISSKRTSARGKFMQEINEEPFDVVVNRYTKMTIIDKLIKRIKNTIKHMK